jgi:NADPH-ferrihemoprotein reductase
LKSQVLIIPRYDFNVLDQVPSDALVFFVIATYGEGEPTDNTIGLIDFLKADELELSKGGNSLPELKYIVFSLGNSTYEDFCASGRFVNQRLEDAGATRIGPAGEGDDDKAMEEDYLAWKDEMWIAVERQMALEERVGGDVPDFEVNELVPAYDANKTYLGELSHPALVGSRVVHDSRNPFISPVVKVEELFPKGDRNCVFVEFDIASSGMKYRTGDHLGVWPLNPDREVERFLRILQLDSKRDRAIDIISLDPALAKVPFPVPTTYDSVFRHYLDITQLPSRQAIHSLAKFAPINQARAMLEKLGTDKNYYHSVVAEKGLRLSEVLVLAAGDSLTSDLSTVIYTPWAIPFEHIISCISRLQPRYYSISSSSRLYPNSIHITAVVAKFKPSPSAKDIYGLGSNYLLNLKRAANRESSVEDEHSPVYTLDGPRGKYKTATTYAVPIHTRLSKFHLPKSVKIPLIMIGPGTGVAPFRGFIQERVALARRAKASKGPDALADWATMDLFYGCRRADWDFLYKDEWVEYGKELDGKFRLHVALSREPGKPKKYVQHLVEEQAERVFESLIDKKGTYS